MPEAQVEVVPDADHGLPLQLPAIVNARILRFIAETHQGAGPAQQTPDLTH
jgi:pimeloyl-ACP methyl ester carboxylesterase